MAKVGLSGIDHCIMHLLESDNEVAHSMGNHMSLARGEFKDCYDAEESLYWYGKLVGMYEAVMLIGGDV